MAVIAIFSVLMMNVLNRIENLKNADGKKVYLSTVVCASEESRTISEARNCTLKVLSSESSIIDKGDKVILIYDAPDNFELGTRIDGEFVIRAMDEDNFSFISEGINCFVSADDVRFLDSGIFIYALSGKIQNFIKETLLSRTDNSGLLIGMLYGERGFISDKLLSYVKACGASHILSVSGLHFAVICGAFIKLCNVFIKKQRLKDFFTVLFVLLFSLVCGFQVSVLRAASVYLLLVLYRGMGRNHNSLVGFSDALLIVLFIHPAAFHSVSFQLSFSAVLGILVLYPYFSKAIYYRFNQKPVASYILKAAAVCLSATLLTFPTSVYYFGWVSLVSLPVNVLIGPAVTAMLVLALFGVLFFAVGTEFLGNALFFCCDAFADYFRKTVQYFAELPFSCITFKNTEVLTALVLLLYSAVYLLYTCKRRPDLVKLYKDKISTVMLRKKEA